MPKTRNEIIDEYFNGSDWSRDDDLTLMNSLRYRAEPYTSLSSMKVFDEVIKKVQGDLEMFIPGGKTLLDVKLRIRALKSRFGDFKEFIQEPGVSFNPQTLRVTVDSAKRKDRTVGQTKEAYKENITRRWFKNHGFPVYNYCAEVFDQKRAAPVDFFGHPGYAHMQPFYIDESDSRNGQSDEQMGGVDKQIVIYGHDFGGSSSGQNY